MARGYGCHEASARPSRGGAALAARTGAASAAAALRVDFGINVRRAREGAGLTQRVLARRSGLTERRLAMIERAESTVRIRAMVALARALRLPLAELMVPSDGWSVDGLVQAVG